MATDLMNELGGTYDSNYIDSALRQSRWQEPRKPQQQDQGVYGSENIPLSENNTSMTIDDMDDAFLRMRDEIRNDISQVLNNATSVKKLSGQYKLATTDEYQGMMIKLDTLTQKNTALTTQIKWRIQTEKRKISENTTNINSLKIQEFNNMVMSFKKACNVFSQALNQFDAVVRGEQKRQLSIVDVDNTLTEDAKNKLINNDDFGAVQKFLDQKYLMTDATNDVLLKRLSSLEQQHDGLIRIERSVKELSDLYNELNIMVIEQQDLIDSVEQNVVETKEMVQSGTKHLAVAEKHQKKTRKMMVIGTICCLVILLIIVISVAT